jgi:hypothetical protein
MLLDHSRSVPGLGWATVSTRCTCGDVTIGPTKTASTIVFDTSS